MKFLYIHVHFEKNFELHVCNSLNYILYGLLNRYYHESIIFFKLL